MKSKVLRVGLVVLVLMFASCHWGNGALRRLESDKPSKSKGSTSRGSLQYGKRLPTDGENFSAYSQVGALMGRMVVHQKVRDAVVSTYADLAKAGDRTHYIIGETGWAHGGRFWPHRTHQNGLSVDFMVPVRRGDARDELPTWPWFGFGYGIDFDKKGVYDDLRIDFDAVARHLCTLAKTSRRHGVRVKRVIFAPELRAYLYKTKAGPCVRKSIAFMKRRAWVRHDDHYHVDFELTR